MSVLLVGAGGHARVVLSALESAAVPVSGYVDDDPTKEGALRGYPLLGRTDIAAEHPGTLILALGSNRLRQHFASRLGETAHWATAIHLRAVVCADEAIGPGAVVFAGAVIQPGAQIGPHAIVNTGASVDHDCRVGAFAHLAPGVRLAGNVSIETGAFLGIGSVVIPGCTVGAWATVGAGSVVVRDIPPGVTAYGNPARIHTP